ncbi:HAMP domain-containing protein [bacterium]|nr:HAMP domain-containing protein [bacterium]
MLQILFEAALLGGITITILGLLLLGLRRHFGDSILIKLMFWNSLLLMTGGAAVFLLERFGISPLTLGIAAALGTTITVAVIVVIYRQIVLPIRKLAAASHEMSTGNLEIEFDCQQRDEIGSLTQSLNEVLNYQRSMSVIAGQIASGDLSTAIEPRSNKDVLGNTFVQLVSSLRHFAHRLQANAVEVGQASKKLSQNAAEAEDATSQINQTIANIADGASQQAYTIEMARNSLTEHDSQLEHIAVGAQQQSRAVAQSAQMRDEQRRSIDEVRTAVLGSEEAVQRTRLAADSGIHTVQETINGMQAIARAVDQVNERMAEMAERNRQISVIVATIDDLSERTNLLALNAAIEAARAGQHGKGFAVVADEVRKLAERSTRSTAEITSLIQSMQHSTTQTIRAMDKNRAEVARGLELAGSTQSGFVDIQKAVAQVSASIQGLTSSMAQMENSSQALQNVLAQVAEVTESNGVATQRLSTGSRQILQMFEELSAISEQNSAAASQVAASTDEVNNQVTQTGVSAQGLDQLAGGLQALAQQFQLNEAPSTRQAKMNPPKRIEQDSTVQERQLLLV